MTLNLTPTTAGMKTISPPRITVIGVGGGGGNAVDNMISTDLKNVDFIVANTDAQQLNHSKAERRVQLGPDLTRGLGAGAKPEIGRQSAEEVAEEIRKHLDGADLVFITAGMGGGTGTGAAPVIARIARESGALTIGVVSKPFKFEGRRRSAAADEGIAELQKYVDTLIVIPNQNLFSRATQSTTLVEAFKMADEVLYMGVRGIADLMVIPGEINLDFADVKTVIEEMGKAMMGTGIADTDVDGEERAILAAERAISNPLLEETSMKGARGLLINVTGGKDLSLHEVNDAVERIREEIHEDANLIFGVLINEEFNGKIQISVVATGIDTQPKELHQTQAEPSAAAPPPQEEAAASQPHDADSAAAPHPGGAGRPAFQPDQQHPPRLGPFPQPPSGAPGLNMPASVSSGRPGLFSEPPPRQPEPEAPRGGLFSRLFRGKPAPQTAEPSSGPRAAPYLHDLPAQPRDGARPQPPRKTPGQDSPSQEDYAASGESADEPNLDIPTYLRRP